MIVSSFGQYWLKLFTIMRPAAAGRREAGAAWPRGSCWHGSKPDEASLCESMHKSVPWNNDVG